MSTAPRTRRAKSTSTKGHYITNAVLLPEVLRAKKLGRITNELAKMFMLIAERYSFKSNFAGYSFRDDMVSFALINLCANGLKFDPEKSNNPFAFYTTAIHNSFLQYMAHERNHRDIRDQLIIESGAIPSNSYMDSSDNHRGDGAYDEHGEVAHSGYSEFKPAPVIEPEPVKRVKQPSLEEQYLQRAKEIGIPTIDDEHLEEANEVKRKIKEKTAAKIKKEIVMAPEKEVKIPKEKKPKAVKEPKEKKTTAKSKKEKASIIDHE